MQESFDAVIVLANLMDRNGELNDESRGRADLALSAFSQGLAGVIVPCGWAYRPDSKIAIGDAIAFYLEQMGVTREAIIVENRSRDTVGDAVFSKLRLRARRVLVATSDYHVPRALEIFRFIYGPGSEVQALAASTPSSAEKAQSEQDSLLAFRSTFSGAVAGDDAEIWRRLTREHPFYNGTIYPPIPVVSD